MFKNAHAFSGFSVDDLDKAKEFYGQIIGLEISKIPEGLRLHIGSGEEIFVYPKPNHIPATFTILNFPVEDIDQTVDMLKNKGITFEHYENMTDEKGIARTKSSGYGPDIAWFKDPAGNIL